MRRTHLLGLTASLAIAGLSGTSVLPAAAAGPGPGHDLPNTPGMNVIATAGSSPAFSLAFTGHTDKSGLSHGSIDYVNGSVVLSDLQLSKLAVMDEETAAAGGCGHGAMVIARGEAVMQDVGPVRIWVDLQDRDEGDRVRVRVRAASDDHAEGCGGHEDGTSHAAPADHTTGPSDGHEEGPDSGHDEGHDSGHDSGHDEGHDSGWLHRSGWQPVKSVKVIMKGYVR